MICECGLELKDKDSFNHHSFECSGASICIEVTVNTAKVISEIYEKDQVIIICWDKKHNTSTVTTYGKTFIDSNQAACGGNSIKKSLGWPDKLCHDESYRVRTVKEALKRFKTVINELDCKCTETHFCDIHEDLVLVDQAIKAVE